MSESIRLLEINYICPLQDYIFYIFSYLMDNFLNRLEQQENCKQILRASCKKNKINTSLASILTIPKLKFLSQKFQKIQRINRSSNEQQKQSINDNWMQNQLKAFNWIIVAYSGLENVLISNFEKDWIIMQNIFEDKSRNFLKYQARRCLQEKKSKNKNWSEQEDKILFKIVNEVEGKQGNKDNQQILKGQFESKEHMKCQNNVERQQKHTIQQQKQSSSKEKVHWNSVARRLFEQSYQKFFRTAKHCRQRWLNYIDPKKIRGKWSDEEDSKLLKLVQQKGKKWAEIAQILQRTQHNVKNRFNSIEIMNKKDSKRRRKQNNHFTTIQKAQQHSQSNLQSQNQSENQPKITINHPKQRQYKPQQINEPQYNQMQGLQQVQPYLRTADDPSISTRGQCYILSPFSYSPKNLTPFLRSPSPLTFSLFNYRSFVPQHQQTFEGAFKSQGNIFLNPPEQ